MKIFRTLFCGTPIALLTGALLWSSLAGAQTQTFELKATHFLPPNHTFHKELVRWGDELSKKSNGRLTIKVFPSSQMGPTPRQFDLVRTGVADIGVGLTGATPGRFPLTEVSNLAFVVNESEKSSALITKLAPQYLAKEFADVKLLQLVLTPPLKFHMANTNMSSVSAFKGMRIRYAGALFAESIKAFGATPVSVSPGEVVDAMSKGTVDGAMFPYEGAQSFKVDSVAKFSHEPGVNAASFFWVMNRDSYDKLPPDLRALIDHSTGPANAARIGKLLDDQETEGRAYMASKGVQIIRFPEATQAEMRSLVKPIIEKYLAERTAQGEPAGKFYDAMLQGR